MGEDLIFYLECAVEERLSDITSSGSPLMLERKVEDYYHLRPRDRILSTFFVYASPDSELIERPLHRDAQTSLGFQVRSELFYRTRDITTEQGAVFKKIFDYLSQQGIPLYVAVRNEVGEEAVVMGYNPRTGTTIRNPHLSETMRTTLPELLA